MEQENRFKKDAPKPLKDALFKVFTAYWTFFEDVCALFWSKERHKGRGLGSHIKDFFTGKVEKVKGDVESFKHICEEARKDLKNANDLKRDKEHEMLLTAVERVDKQLTQQTRDWFREQRRLFMEWFQRVDMDDKLEDEIGKRTPDTGEWIFKDPQYRRWIHGRPLGADARSQVLWLSAGPGFGKSSLMALLAHDARRTLQTGVAYYAFNSNSSTNSIPALLRTVAHQLYSNETPLGEPHFAFDPSTLNHGFLNGVSPPNMRSLIDIFNDMARVRKTTIVIIDALDECSHTHENEQDMKKLFNFIAQLPPQWRFIISSRLSPWFKDDMLRQLDRCLDSRVLTKDDNNTDIYAYIDAELDTWAKEERLKWNDEEFRTWFEDKLCTKSEGMFKWTTLVLHDESGVGSDQAKRDKSYAREKLENAPADILEIYRGVLDRMSEIKDPMVKDDMTRALKFIVRSYRPMRVVDLQLALSIGNDLGVRDQLLSQLGEHLGDLVYINPKTWTVGLTHTSARDFLTTIPRHKCPNGEQVIPDRLDTIDEEMSLACLRYLSDNDHVFFSSNPVSAETDRRFARDLDQADFFEYAAVGWIHHLGSASKAGCVTEAVKAELALLFSDRGSRQVLKWLQVFAFVLFRNRVGAAEAYSTVLNALFGMPSATHQPLALLLQEQCPNFFKHFGWADGKRFLRWQKFLAVPVPPCFSSTLLASFFNYREDLEEMIEDGETLHYHGREARPNAPFWAASGDSTSTLELLLSKEHIDKFPNYHHGLQGRGGSSILKEATFIPRNILDRAGTYPTALMLVEKGCHVSYDFEVQLFENIVDSTGARELVAKIMVKIPPAFTFKDDSIGNALSYAAFTGQSHILTAMSKNQRFLRRTIEVYSPTLPKELQDHPSTWLLILASWCWRGMSPIHHAAAINDSRATRLLCIDSGHCEVCGPGDRDDPCEDNGWTPLHLAAQRGREKLRHRKGPNNEILTDLQAIQPGEHSVHVLLEAKHDPGRADLAGNLPIHLAAYTGCEETISKLSSIDYHWDKPNKDGKTPLAIALELRNVSAARLLIRHGASPDRVPQNLRSYVPADDGHDLSSSAASASWISIALSLRAATKNKWIPIPIIAHILRLGGFYDHFVERHDFYRYHELTPDMPYLQSPPLRSIGTSLSVKRIVINIRSARDPGTGLHKWEKTWSWIRMDKLDAKSGKLVPWHERSLLRHNYCDFTTETIEFVDHNERDAGYLRSLNPGDRIVISPIGIYPAWYAIIEWASISVELNPVIREAFSNQDRKKIWSMPDREISQTLREGFRRMHDGERQAECLSSRRQDDSSRKASRKLPLRRPKR